MARPPEETGLLQDLREGCACMRVRKNENLRGRGKALVLFMIVTTWT